MLELSQFEDPVKAVPRQGTRPDAPIPEHTGSFGEKQALVRALHASGQAPHIGLAPFRRPFRAVPAAF